MNYIYRLLTKLVTWQVCIWSMILFFIYKVIIAGVWEQRQTIVGIIMNAFQNSTYYNQFLDNVSEVVQAVTPYLYQLDFWVNVNQLILVFCAFLVFRISWFVTQMIVKIVTVGQF